MSGEERGADPAESVNEREEEFEEERIYIYLLRDQKLNINSLGVRFLAKRFYCIW